MRLGFTWGRFVTCQMFIGLLARRGSPDPAESTDRRSPAGLANLRSVEWLGQETGHSEIPGASALPLTSCFRMELPNEELCWKG